MSKRKIGDISGESAPDTKEEKKQKSEIEIEKRIAERQYQILIGEQAFKKIEAYLNILRLNIMNPGKLLAGKLQGKDINTISVLDFAELIIQSKMPRINAEKEEFGNDKDWNQDEASILGDINIVVPAATFDNGKDRPDKKDKHELPFITNLYFVPGALLSQKTSPDLTEVVGTSFDFGNYIRNYNALYDRRLQTALLDINNDAKMKGKKALITVPGIGCGFFAPQEFRPKMKQYFKGALEAVLDNHKDKLDSISGIHYDSYDDMEIQGEKSFNNIKFVTQTSIYNSGPSQLCRSSEYGKAGEFAECERYNIVAADHLAWPGNDFIYGNRETDEGRKGAATDVIGVMCGISGSYRTVKFADGYHPPEPYKNWYDLIIEKRIQIQVKEKIFVVSNDGIKTPLEEYQLKQSDSKSAPFSVEPLLEHSSIKPQVATSLSTSNPAQKPIEKEGGGR